MSQTNGKANGAAMRSGSDIRIQFNEDAINNAKIKVIGVGGGGGNAVNRMICAKVEGHRVHRREHRRAGTGALAGAQSRSSWEGS